MPKKPVRPVAIKKTGYQHQTEKLGFEDKFAAVTDTPLTKAQDNMINKRIQHLSKVLCRYAIIWNSTPPNMQKIMQTYIRCYHQCYEYDQFDPSFSPLPSLDVNLYTVGSEELIYKSLNVFHHCRWPVRFHNKFVSRVSGYKVNQIKYILSFIMFLAQGNFVGRKAMQGRSQYGFVVPIDTRSFNFNRFFYMKIFRQKNILFSVGVQKLPIVRNGAIKRYEFTSYIYILDLVADNVIENPNRLTEAITRFADGLHQDVARKDHADQLVINDTHKNKRNQEHHLFVQQQNPYRGQKQVFVTEFSPENNTFYTPITFKPYYVSLNDTSSLFFDKQLKRWVTANYLSNLEQKALNEFQRKVNQEMIKRFVDFQSAKTLVQLLTKIPNFKVQLTQQQKDVIGQNGNVLVIGRSGTGKTTCAVLRLFAIEMLFKIRLSLSKKKFQQSLKDTRCSADDIDKTLGLHCVFLTASPVLTNQIQRYYKKLTDNIKIQLEKKKKRDQEKIQKERQEFQSLSMKKKEQIPQNQSMKAQQLKPVEVQEEIVEKEQVLEIPSLQVKKSKQLMEEQEQMNKELGNIKLQQKIQNEEFQEDEQNYDEMKDQLEQKMKRFKSLYDLKEEDYPGFFTVKSFLMMIDGTLPKPFFIRKSEQTQAQSQATWHNQKKGVMMIENYFRTEEEENKQIIEEQIEEQINYSDQQQLQHEYLRQIQLRQNKEKQNLTAKLNKKKLLLSFEVDYDYFYTYFWPNVKHKHYSARNITAHLVWTEIFSTIKGGANAHLYPGFYLNQKAYLSQSANGFLTKEEKLDIYETFCQYERWKINSGGYDIMDAVNYILNFIRFRGYPGPQIHYVMIDQVQDLPHAIVYLLTKTIKYGVFYSGDTAQTIAKGVGFRFCDLKNLFDPKQFDSYITLSRPVVKQLTVNFRSHNNILQLANSVVSSIEILFPKTIDRLKKQVSNLSGPKPMILAEKDEELLFYVLCGDEYKKNNETVEGFKKPPLQFGCDQVILVRDQESKNKIPSMLQHALCLTIYEAKGLQFNDVILFNFFAESKCVDKWGLMKFLKVVINQMDAEDYEKSITKRIKQKPKQQQEKKQEIQQPGEVDVECIVQNKEGKINVKKIVSDAKIILKDINDYAELCSELKMLYTAITRPKNTLIIYDQDATARKSIQKLWQKLEVVELVSKQLLQQSNKKNKPESEELKIFKAIVNSTDSSEWKKQGMKMYSRGYFEQAMKCFQRSGNDQLYKKAMANNIADNATKKLIEIESERNAISNKLIQYQKITDYEISKIKKKLKKQQLSTYTKFEQAAKIFETLLMFKQAGQCYFSGRKYQNAYENFSKAFMNKQAGQSLQMLNKYRQAADYYEKEGLFLKVIECLDLINQWEQILKVIKKFQSQMSDLEKKSLYKKYSALALQQLVYQIQFENQPEQNKPENNRVEIIKQEEDSQDEDWDSDEDPEIAAEKALSRRSQSSKLASRKQSHVSLENQQDIMRKASITESQPRRKQSQVSVEQDKIKQSIYQNVEVEKKVVQNLKKDSQNSSQADQSSFCDLNESSQLDRSKSNQQVKKQQKIQDQVLVSIHEKPKNEVKKQQKIEEKKMKKQDLSNSSFADLNQSESSFADLNSQHSDYNTKYAAELEPDIQSIRSMADPEDLWIQSALSEIPAKTNTQYSIIDEQQNYNPNIRIIKTKGNIVVQDEIMRKIVSIVSMVNQSIEQFFKQFKGYQSLITVAKEPQNEENIDYRPEISEFEDVDPKFINIILDTLQSFKLYKLCLFVCNRYHMPHKAGRYLVSMALKYSTNAQINNSLNSVLIAPSISRKLQLQKGILASIALHAIFENVSADFLKVKVHQHQKQQSKNTLGGYFIEGLILQGLYKKAVFMVNPEESLKILRNFCDMDIYQQLYKQKFLKRAAQEPSQFLDYIPKSQQEQQYTILKLQQMLFHNNVINRLETISQRFYKEFNVSQIKNNHQPSKVPDYSPLLKVLMNLEEQNTVKNYDNVLNVLNVQIAKCAGYLKNGPNHKIYDVVAFITTIINRPNLHQYVFELKPTQFLQFMSCVRAIRTTLKKQNSKKSYEILQSVFSVYCSRMIDPCKSTRFINDGYALVYRASIMCNQFIQELKKFKDQTAFFFEQDYNYIIVRSLKLIEVVSKRFDSAYCRFLKNRVQAQINWVSNLNQEFLESNFQDEQSEYLIRALFREQIRLMSAKDKKKKTVQKAHKKQSKPKFNYKMQGRPQLVMDLQSSLDQIQEEHIKDTVKNLFIFPDLNSEFKDFYDLSISAYYNKLAQSQGKNVSGRLLYGAGLNDSYKEYLSKKEGHELYDAIQFRKFHRLDLYADNLLAVIKQLSYTQRHLYSAEILIHLMIQYKCMVNGKNFKIDMPRRFLKFLPNLKLKQIIGLEMDVDQANINDFLKQKKHICAFTYNNLYSSELEKKQIAELICEFLDILKVEYDHKCYSIQKLILILLLNMPNNQQVYQSLREFIEAQSYNWTHPVLLKIKGTANYQQFSDRRQKIIKDEQFIKNSQMLHQIRVIDTSNSERNITESQQDYDIKEKIMQARLKASNKIAAWWRIVKKKSRPADQLQIVRENRMVKITHHVQYLPVDDCFLLRSAGIRNVLFSFYLKNSVSSSLDFHYILMTLNKIEDLRREYIKAYYQGISEISEKQTDFEQQIASIESQIQIWKNDSKWLKDKNYDLKRKKVFEVKWLTKSAMNKVIKKRAGLQKQKKLEVKKKMLKKAQL